MKSICSTAVFYILIFITITIEMYVTLLVVLLLRCEDYFHQEKFQ